MKTVLFYEANLNERGTSVATYDYAHYNECILGNKSIIVSPKDNTSKTYNKYKQRFELISINSFNEIHDIKCDYFYHMKYGFNDGTLHNNAKNLVHVVFPSYDPHGDVYAYISKWLAENFSSNAPFVPYMVDLPYVEKSFKQFFNIKNQLVVGWYGGNTFEIPFARQAVIDTAIKRDDIIFIFMNQEPFCDLSNVFFIDGTTDLKKKVEFINTCDIMIHARERGETFGLAIAEFSTMNKPIITYSNPPERCHIDILGDKGIYYEDYFSLINILKNIQHSDIQNINWNCYQEYTPDKVMQKFNNVFLT